MPPTWPSAPHGRHCPPTGSSCWARWIRSTKSARCRCADATGQGAEPCHTGTAGGRRANHPPELPNRHIHPPTRCMSARPTTQLARVPSQSAHDDRAHPCIPARPRCRAPTARQPRRRRSPDLAPPRACGGQPRTSGPSGPSGRSGSSGPTRPIPVNPRQHPTACATTKRRARSHRIPPRPAHAPHARGRAQPLARAAGAVCQRGHAALGQRGIHPHHAQPAAHHGAAARGGSLAALLRAPLAGGRCAADRHRSGLGQRRLVAERRRRATGGLAARGCQEGARQPQGVQRVVVERPPFNIRDYLWSGTMGLMSALGQLTVVVFLTYFALASGNLFRNKLLRIAGTSLERRKVTIHVLEDITNQIQRYLMVQVFPSVLVGVATGLAYWALGLENAAVWGVAAGVLNLAPYIGSALVTGASALVAFLQFGTLDMALAIGGASLGIHPLVGNLLTPWLTSRTSSMSPVAVFVSVLAWGWLWGLWGLLLGIPVMMAVKAVGELLGD